MQHESVGFAGQHAGERKNRKVGLCVIIFCIHIIIQLKGNNDLNSSLLKWEMRVLKPDPIHSGGLCYQGSKP